MPTGPMLFVYNKDVPGVIGALGTTLGKHGVNISRMTVGREMEQGREYYPAQYRQYDQQGAVKNGAAA